MKMTARARITEPDTQSRGVSDQAMQHALNNPEIVKYAKNLQRIPLAYEKLLKQQAKK